MKSPVDDVRALVPAGGQPELDLDWSRVETNLGHPLPADYKQLVVHYGPGSFDAFVWLLQPREGNRHLDIVWQRDAQLAALRMLRDSGEDVPYQVEASRAELQPWAITANGDVCYWVTSTSDDPDGWSVAVNEGRGSRWLACDLSASGFLLAILSGSLRVDFFPDDFPSDRPMFEPAAM